MKYLECLPQDIAAALGRYADVREIRIRNGCPVMVNIGGARYFLAADKLLKTPLGALQAGADCAEQVVKTACEHSVFAYEKMLAGGFMTLSDGARIGVGGELVGAAFRRYTSICLRIPHFVHSADKTLLSLLADKPQSVLVVGKPGSGKTTYLRDLACKLSQTYNVTVADERGEISLCESFSQHSCADVLLWCNKTYAFEVGVRSLCPDIIVCDEIAAGDVDGIKNVVNSGVSLLCSVHGSSLEEAKSKLGTLASEFAYTVLLRDDFTQKVVRTAEFGKI